MGRVKTFQTSRSSDKSHRGTRTPFAPADPEAAKPTARFHRQDVHTCLDSARKRCLVLALG